LLTNSIKYAFRQTKVFINVYNEDNYTCFKFENESPYLSEEKRKKIFARYVSFSQSDKINGIGLGLYASQKIVEAHGGEIFVESYEENKNVFGFKIPNDEYLKNSERTVTF
jgi:K+-sensing histidine kinase KdpD